MKIGGRSGHNPKAPGASALVSETIEDRKIFLSSKKYLATLNSFVDCYPGNMQGADTELMWGINKANLNSVHLFYSVHLNKCYTQYDGYLGAEIWLHPVASKSTILKATSILKNLERLGFSNRGVKYSRELAELNSTQMEAMIIECFFCEATKDVETYKKVGHDAVGFAIANGIDNRIKKAVITSHRNVIVYGNDVDMRAALYLTDWLNCKKQDAICIHKKDYKAGMGRSVFTVGGGLNNIKSHVHLQGNNRFSTLQVVCKKIGLC